MKAQTKPLPYLSLDCSVQYVAHIQHSLDEMGFLVTKIIPQYSYLLGYSFRLYFAQPVPALFLDIALEASVTPPSIELFLHDN